MKITADLLAKHGACAEQVARVRQLWPRGVEPAVEVLTVAAAEGLDPWWLWHLLPEEGPGSQRSYALWCAEQVAHLSSDPRVEQCLGVVRRMVDDPASVTDQELAAARAAAWAADRAAAWDAAAWAARAAGDAAWAARAAAAWDDAAWAARAAGYAADAADAEAQLACLSEMLCAL